MLLDPHNEYTRAFGPMAEVIGPSTLQLPYWLFNFEELGEVLKHTGMVMGPAEAALLSELVTAAKRHSSAPAAMPATSPPIPPRPIA